MDEDAEDWDDEELSARADFARELTPPWTTPPEKVAFLALGCEGPDPASDRLLWVEALLVDAEGGTTGLRRECPSEDTEAPADAWRELEEFAQGSLVVVAEAELFRSWNGFLGMEEGVLGRTCGLDQIGALLFPGRGKGPGRGNVPADEGARPPELRKGLEALARRFFQLDRDAVHALSVGLATTWARLFLSEPVAAERLARVLSLLSSVDRWVEGLGPVPGPRFQSDAIEADFLPLVLEDVQPAWAIEAKDWYVIDPLPPDRESTLHWGDAESSILEATFREHLPQLFSASSGAKPEQCYRPGQHDVAREVASNFGRHSEPETQLLLVHAPTGTGKTLAYLIPAMIWARKHDVRVGIATYTRALQEQAIDREVPRALEALSRAGLQPGLRVSMLKGRENYLCWRTLRLHIPSFEAPGEAWLAFCQLLAFSISDSTGDLDRLPRRSPLELKHNPTYRKTLTDLVRQVHARTSCCRAKEDRATCGAETARMRAERSHLVVTNHSFALARQEFFRHLVFDECEHLHDQAHSAWSHSVGLTQIQALLDRLYQPELSRGRSLFVRISKRIVDGTPTWESLNACRELWASLSASRGDLAEQIAEFNTWRAARIRERDEREDHSMLREYVESELGNKLLLERTRFCRNGNRLDEKLAELSERLEKLGAPRMARLRRTIELARTELAEIIDSVSAWLPMQEGRPCFNSRTFHDVEVGNAGVQMTARVLLPNEYLGRYFYPQLSTASFLSATTHMQGGFDAATAYLGLDRAVQVAEDDPDLLCKLHTFKAPEVFDYSRVLVTVQRDAPSVSRDKEAFLAYARNFLADLGERTRGRILALFTNAEDVKAIGARLEGVFRARRIPFWYQNMPGTSKEEMSDLFRSHTDSILLGVDTFWYGADFPGQTLEHLVLVRLPYGVPDRYHHAQCAVLGIAEQRRQIYMPRALAKFRQGFGRLMRRVDDRGCVYILDNRIVEPRHRAFLRELPIAGPGETTAGLARLVRGETERCLQQAMIHMGLELGAQPLAVEALPARHIERFEPDHDTVVDIEAVDVDMGDLPF